MPLCRAGKGGMWNLLPMMSGYNKRAMKADPRTETGLSECPFI